MLRWHVREWYDTLEWRKFRQKIIERDKHKCTQCDAPKNLQVHHIKRATLRPDLFFDESNCKTLCKEHHNRLHQEAQATYVYDEEGFEGNDPDEMILCECERFYHLGKYRMCYECYLNRE